MENKISSKGLVQVFNLLKFTFVIVPIVAGLDKFTNLLVDWSQYLHPSLIGAVSNVHVFMIVVGIVEIAAGLLVFFKPALGGMVVALWLTLIALALLASGHFIDVAVRDLVMAISALSMVQISRIVQGGIRL